MNDGLASSIFRTSSAALCHEEEARSCDLVRIPRAGVVTWLSAAGLCDGEEEQYWLGIRGLVESSLAGLARGEEGRG